MKKNKKSRLSSRQKKSYEQLRKKKRKKQFIQIVVFMLLVIIFSSVVTFFFGSDYTKISQIYVDNNKITSKEEIINESQIKLGQRYWSVDEQNAIAQLKKQYPIIKEVNITKKFPNIVNIHIEEFKVAGYFNFNDKNELYLEDGQKLNDMKHYLSYPIATNFNLNDPQQKIYATELMKQMSQIPSDVQQQISEIAYTPTDNNPKHITAYMQDGMIVVGDLSTFGVKIQYYPQMKANIPINQEGHLDLEVGAFFDPINGKKQRESTSDTASQNHNTMTTLSSDGQIKEVEVTSR